MIKLPVIVLGLMLLLTGTTQKVMAQDEDVSMQTFYDELSPYGSWIQDPQYGYVWRPDVDQQDFRPYYSNGHWAMTEYGNTWVSDYDWGWAPFHYGRWVTDRYNQWLWIPDTTWGPAWVNWRSGGGYYGWAPLGPGLGVNVSVGFNIPDFWWVFTPQASIYIDRFPRYYSNRNYGYLGRTTIINNVYVRGNRSYYSGPRRDEIRRVTNRDVRVYNIDRSNRPGRSYVSNNSIHMYNPRPNRNVDNRNAAPRNVAQRGDNGRPGDRSDRNADNRNSGQNRNGLDQNRNGQNRNDQNRNEQNRNEQNRNSDQNPNARNRNFGGDQNRNAGDNQNRSERSDMNRGQRSPEDQQRIQAQNQQRQQQMQQRQREQGQRSDAQNQERQQQMQQRQQQTQREQGQRSQEQNQQMQQQRQQQMQQRREQQNQQRQQQSQQQQQQRQEQQNQQRQQQAQQQQQRQMERPQRQERVSPPARTAENNRGGARTGGRPGRG